MAGRPMIVAQVDPNECIVTFVTRDRSELVTDVEFDPHVQLSGMARGKYLSASGLAEVARDTNKARNLAEGRRVQPWVASGSGEPVLVRVKVESGAFWRRRPIRALLGRLANLTRRPRIWRDSA